MNKKKTQLSILLIPLVLVLTLFFGCQTQPDEAAIPESPVVLKIVETTDIHGAILPYDFISDRELSTSLSHFASYIKEERANQDQHVILIDDGDILQGQPIVYYYNFEKPDSTHICADVMNYLDYDVGVVGNHDIEAGHPVYDKLVNEFDFPWLAANAINASNKEPYFEPYTIINRGGVKIAVLGLITPWIPNWLPEKIWSGMEFEDMIESAGKWVKIIEEKEDPDLLIGAFHAGVDYTYNKLTADTPKNENASQLVAERVPGFDIIFVGHDHQGHNFAVKNSVGEDVLILGALNGVRTAVAANVVMKYDQETKTWQKEIEGEIIEIGNYKPDESFQKQFNYAFTEVRDYVSDPIGEFTRTISTREAMFGDSAFVDLIHRIQLSLTEADVSFAAPLSFDTEITKGPIYGRDMFKLYVYENLLYTMEMTGQEIKDFLEYSYDNWFNQMTGPDDHLMNFKIDENGKPVWSERYKSYDLNMRYYNYDSAAGINYTVDVSKPKGEFVTIASMANGERFDLNKRYKVAINSYRGNGGGGHLENGAGIPKEEFAQRTLSSTIKDLRYYLMRWIEEAGVVDPQPLGNWQVVPADWWAKAKEVDYKMLFEPQSP